jgi:CBS domain-containing membrane protein
VVGLVTRADFLRDAHVDISEGPEGRLEWRVATDPVVSRGGPAVVGEIMSRRVRVASADRTLAEVVPIFSESGHHHLPVVGADGALRGILTQTDVVRALRRVAETAPTADA